MIAWMIYVIVVTLILSIAALLAEHAARQLRIPGRWIWAVAIVSSLLIPTVISSVSVQLPNLLSPAASQQMIVLRAATAVHVPFIQAAVPNVPAPSATAPELPDRALRIMWIAVSLCIFALLFASGALLMQRKRRWTPAQIGSAQVLVAPDVGPAVVGLLRAHIVVPAWLAQAPAAQQDMVIEHEQSHLDAFDPQLLSVALCLLVLMPWNLPLWWQLRRLRRAIEVDCDARVVRGGHNLAAYGEALLAVGQHQSGFMGMAAAMSESASFLEQRIAFMLAKPARWNGIAAALLGCLAAAACIVATEISPPNAADSDFGVYDHIALAPGIINGYVGNYQLDEHQVLTITNDGGHMHAQLTLQPLFDPLAINQTSFNTKTLKLRMTFITDEHGRATAVRFHYWGEEASIAPRIDDALARKINDDVSYRVSTQTAMPGSEAALRRLIAQFSATPLNYYGNGIAPQVSRFFQNQDVFIRPRMARLGAMKSIEFVGVSEYGRDKYLVRYEHGSAQWAIEANAKGIITGAQLSP